VNSCVRVLAISLLAGLAATSSVAQSSRSTPERQAQRAVELRQSLFRIISYGYTPLGDMLKKKAPFDADVADKSASLLVVLAPLVVNTFKVDTRQFGVKTWATDEIWTNWADFQAKSAAFTKASEALADAVKSRDEKKILQAAAAVGRSCSSCHDAYSP